MYLKFKEGTGYQVLLQDYGQSGLWKNRKINIKKK